MCWAWRLGNIDEVPRRRFEVNRSFDALGVPSSVPIIIRDQVERAKPDPGLFVAAAEKLDVEIARRS